MIPPELQKYLDALRAKGWTGTLSLNLKEGEIIAFEVTEKHRISRETHASRGPERTSHA